MISFVLSFVAGLLTAVSPCVLPALPLIVGSAGLEHRHAPLAVAGGMVTAFTAMGLLLSSFGHVLGLDPEVLRNGGAAMLVLMGLILLVPRAQLSLAGFLTPLAGIGNNVSAKSRFKGLKGQFGLGALLGFVWSPCSGPTLGAALSLASGSGLLKASGMMFLFGIGAAVPLVLIAYGSRALFQRKRTQILSWGANFKPVFGVLALLVGLAVLTKLDKRIEASLTNALPEAWLDLTTRF